MYDESVFMWTPTEYTTISVFTCWDASIPYSQFTTTPGDTAAIFSLSNREIASISMVAAPEGAVEYRQYSRQHGHVFSEVSTHLISRYPDIKILSNTFLTSEICSTYT